MRADRELRLVIASYGALLLGPLPTLLVPRDPPVPGLPWLVLAVGLVGGGTLGYALVDWFDLRSHLSNVLGGSIAAVLPLGYLVWLFALAANNPGMTPGNLLIRTTTVGIFAFLPAMVAIHLALDAAGATDAETLAAFTARPAPRTRRLRFASLGVGLGIIVGLGLSLFLNGRTSPLVLAVLGLAVVSISWVVFQTAERTVRIREDGIEVDGTLTRWDDVERFEVADDSLVVRLRSAWTDDVRFDRSDIGAFEDVRATLAELTEEGA
jgi:hypothetical protein